MGGFPSKNSQLQSGSPSGEIASHLAATLRNDPDYLVFVQWAKEQQHNVKIDDNCWLHHSRVTPGFTSSGTLSIDNRTTWDAFKVEYLLKQLKMKGMIEEANQHARGGLIRITI